MFTPVHRFTIRQGGFAWSTVHTFPDLWKLKGLITEMVVAEHKITIKSN